MHGRTLNLGILAHVDAGKTTLTERLLYAAGVIREPGSVDRGTTQTDSLPLEQERGITIRSAVVSFPLDGVAVNLIDTPGHPDFVAEVERALGVLDGAVLVVSAVEGVQAQTPLLMGALQRLRVPTLLFVNKTDRRGADCDRALASIRERLTPAAVPLRPQDADGLLPTLAERDEELLAAYVHERPVAARRLREALAAQTRRALAYPVFFGSARTGAGVHALRSGIVELLPAADGDPEGPLAAAVFKVERGADGERLVYARVFSGTLRTRDRVRLPGGEEQKVTEISVFEGSRPLRSTAVAAGAIGLLRGLDARSGDSLGAPGRAARARHFAPPSFEAGVAPARPEQRGALHAALVQLAEQDPLIALRQDDRGGVFVSLYGEVQREVIQVTLEREYGLEAEFRETTVVCVERPLGTGAAVERLHEERNPFLATVGLRVEPAPPGSGVRYRREVAVHGTMPPAFFRAVEDTVRQTLREGLYGWNVTDCTVTLTDAGYLPRQSHAHQGFNKAMSSTGEDFRKLTPLVLMSALAQAGTAVCEPVHRFRLGCPADTLAAVFSALAPAGAVTGTPEVEGSWARLEGEVRAARTQGLRRRLGSLTRGEGALELSFDRYEPVEGEPPGRPRTGPSPLRRSEYLLAVSRGLGDA